MCLLIHRLLGKCFTAVAKIFSPLEGSLLIGIKLLILRTRIIGIKCCYFTLSIGINIWGKVFTAQLKYMTSKCTGDAIGAVCANATGDVKGAVCVRRVRVRVSPKP